MIINTLMILLTLSFPLYSMETETDIPQNSRIVTGLDLSFKTLNYPLSDLKILKSYPNLTSLNLDGQEHLTSLNGIEHLTRLRKLDLTFCQNLDDISALTALTNLEKLNLRNIASGQFDLIATLPKLHTLTVSTAHVLPYTLSTITNLQLLIVEGHWDQEEQDQVQRALPAVKVVFEPYL